MNEKLYKLSKQETKINKGFRKIYYNIETNEYEMNKINKEIKNY